MAWETDHQLTVNKGGEGNHGFISEPERKIR